jgi:hypothetical protein
MPESLERLAAFLAATLTGLLLAGVSLIAFSFLFIAAVHTIALHVILGLIAVASIAALRRLNTTTKPPEGIFKILLARVGVVCLWITILTVLVTQSFGGPA